MSFFKWLVNACEKSLDKENREYEQIRRREQASANAQASYQNSIECCANCIFLDAHTRYDSSLNSDYRYWCMKDHVSYSLDDVKRSEHYKHTCYEFCRK